VLATHSCCTPSRLELLWVTPDRVFAEALLLVASSDRYDIARTTDLTSDAKRDDIVTMGLKGSDITISKHDGIGAWGTIVAFAESPT